MITDNSRRTYITIQDTMALKWIFLSFLYIQHGATINDVNRSQKDPKPKDSLGVNTDEVVAFSAELSTDATLTANVPIVFDRTITNARGLYFNNTGQFACVDDNIHVFIWSLRKASSSDNPGMRCIAKLRSMGTDTKYGPKTSYYGTGTSGVAEMTTVFRCITSPPTAVSITSAPWDDDENSVAVYRGAGWTSFSGFRLGAQIAFTAEVMQDHYLFAGGKIRFDNVLFNFGGHYNVHTHSFRCPDNGVYAFSVSTQTKDHTTPWSVSRLMIEGKRVAKGPITYIATSSYDSGSASSNAVIQCTKDFSVYVEAQEAFDFRFNSYGRELSAFTGFKLFDVVEGAVAFMAVMTNNLTISYENQPVVYDDIITNVGNAFDAHASRLTCPDNDYYLFTWTAAANAGGGGSDLFLYMDETRIKYLYLTFQASDDASGTSGTSSASMIKQCSTGSHFQVRAPNVDGTLKFLGGYNSFSGYKIPAP